MASESRWSGKSTASFTCSASSSLRIAAAVSTIWGRLEPPGQGMRNSARGDIAGEVEVALLDLRDLAQRDVPRGFGVGRELAGILVHVDVGIDDPQLRRCLAGTARLRCRRIAWHPKII